MAAGVLAGKVSQFQAHPHCLIFSPVFDGAATQG